MQTATVSRRSFLTSVSALAVAAVVPALPAARLDVLEPAWEPVKVVRKYIIRYERDDGGDVGWEILPAADA